MKSCDTIGGLPATYDKILHCMLGNNEEEYITKIWIFRDFSVPEANGIISFGSNKCVNEFQGGKVLFYLAYQTGESVIKERQYMEELRSNY